MFPNFPNFQNFQIFKFPNFQIFQIFQIFQNFPNVPKFYKFSKFSNFQILTFQKVFWNPRCYQHLWCLYFKCNHCFSGPLYCIEFCNWRVRVFFVSFNWRLMILNIWQTKMSPFQCLANTIHPEEWPENVFLVRLSSPII